MGLGKTLCVLSLICWSLDLLRDTEAPGNDYELSTTLVVIPKSSMVCDDVIIEFSVTVSSDSWMASPDQEPH